MLGLGAEAGRQTYICGTMVPYRVVAEFIVVPHRPCLARGVDSRVRN